MSNSSESFIAKSALKSSDLEHRRKINFNIGKYNATVVQGKKQFEDDIQFMVDIANNTSCKSFNDAHSNFILKKYMNFLHFLYIEIHNILDKYNNIL